MKLWLIVNGLITNLWISTKLNIKYLEEEESILGTSELTELLKINSFRFSL